MKLDAALEARLTQASAMLAECRRQGGALERLPEAARPQSMLEGYEIQRRVHALLGDAPVRHWKTSETGPKGAMTAPIHGSRIFTSPASVGRVNALETEIALQLGQDLPFRDGEPYSREDVLAAVSHYALAFELCASRWLAKDVEVEEKIADCLSNDGLVLGTPVPFTGDILSPVKRLVLMRDGTPEPFAPNDIDPAGSLTAYVNAGGDRFGGFKAGDWIITGSMSGVQNAPAPGLWTARWDDRLEISLTITG
ncbi:hypothetical protein [Pannonibacter phragmitetus]|uniref:hypothetical protein n=1 Tax=Pannonibacter phragmitetus TaxID=121719 RepID=UPI00067D7F10|nr:hypothetical protein [Pannonibacter phragmitetus]